MLNRNAADQFVLSSQHCPISLGKIALDWYKISGWECEDQEFLGSMAASMAGAYLWPRQWQFWWFYYFWCGAGVLMGFGVLGLVGLVFFISSIPCFFPWEAQNFWNYLSSQSNCQAQYCNYLTDIGGITCCLQHIKSYMGYEIKIYKKADTECNSAEFGVWDLSLSEILQSVIYFLRGLFILCFLCTYYNIHLNFIHWQKRKLNGRMPCYEHSWNWQNVHNKGFSVSSFASTWPLFFQQDNLERNKS